MLVVVIANRIVSVFDHMNRVSTKEETTCEHPPRSLRLVIRTTVSHPVIATALDPRNAVLPNGRPSLSRMRDQLMTYCRIRTEFQAALASHLGNVSNTAETYVNDGHQNV